MEKQRKWTDILQSQLEEEICGVHIYRKDGETVGSERTRILEGKQDLDDPNLFDFTHGVDEDDKEIIRQFDELRKGILRINPNARNKSIR